MKKLHLDFETRSTQDIKKVGAYAYARHPSTEITCLSFAIDDGKPRVFTAAQVRAGIPELMFGLDQFRIVAHSAHFEYAIWKYIMHERLGYPALDEATRWDCTLARAAMCNLPLSLDQCGAALGIAAKKDMDGRAAMLKLCKPIGVDPLDGSPIYNEDPALYATMEAYCAGDVRAEQEIDSRLPELPPHERAIFELDLVMNHRGVLMDVPMSRLAASFADKLTTDLNAQLNVLTGGVVDKATRVLALKAYLKTQGLTVDSLDKEALGLIFADPKVPQKLKEILHIRRQVAKTSTAKYETTLEVVDPKDHRARGLLQYHGASTGRWAGRMIQPHNYPKGVKEKEQAEIVGAIMDGDPGMFSLQYGDRSMDALSNALRGTIIAPKGKVLVAADFNAIEPRVLFWLAGEEEALASYRAGGSPYFDMGEFLYKRKITKKDEQEYAVSKMTVLGAGFGMGPPRFKAQCAAAQPTPVYVTDEESDRAIKGYRAKYKKVVALWYAMEGAAKKAIKEPGTTVTLCDGKIVWGMDKKREFLVCRLPSGRHLRYFKPRVRAYIHAEYGEREEIMYWGPGKAGALTEFGTYGGSLTENAVQAIARDLLANGMLNAEATGVYENVLTVHDEDVAEVDPVAFESEYDLRGHEAILKHFMGLLCKTPPWSAGCPVAAEGFVARRYRK